MVGAKRKQRGKAAGASDPGIDVLRGYNSVAAGVDASVVHRLADHGLTREDIRSVIPDRTLERRMAADSPLRLAEADALARLLRVVEHARRTFGEAGLADRWLRTPNPALGGETPIRMARTDLGGREVEAALGRLAHGVFG